MITRDEAERLRDRLADVLAEDAHNAERLLARLDAITGENGVSAHAALLLILTRLTFDEDEARRHWEAVLAHRVVLARALAREVGLRTALLDYFVDQNRRLTRPTLIDLELELDAGEHADRDPLTGMTGERAFRTLLQNELRRAKRYNARVAVVSIDIDDFAGVNARLGQLVGDRLLREMAILLHNKIRDIDDAARLGEDELAVLLPETDSAGALLVAERFREEVESYFAGRECAGQPVDLTVSAGVASYPADATNPEDLLARAAQALYQAKASGKNRVQTHLRERRSFLRFELEPGRFELEVLAAPSGGTGRVSNYSRNGILFSSPERLDLGEEIEIRLADRAAEQAQSAPPIRGRVVRVEELPDEVADGATAAIPGTDRYEIGLALDLDLAEGEGDVLSFLERLHAGRTNRLS